jgi:hypothetical protein
VWIYLSPNLSHDSEDSEAIAVRAIIAVDSERLIPNMQPCGGTLAHAGVVKRSIAPRSGEWQKRLGLGYKVTSRGLRFGLVRGLRLHNDR